MKLTDLNARNTASREGTDSDVIFLELFAREGDVGLDLLDAALQRGTEAGGSEQGEEGDGTSELDHLEL
jgi:hypothetical protein